MRIPKPLILFIDAYDSFSNNIISLLETTLDVSVRTIKIDDPALATDEALHAELRHYVAVVCGPGPGHPEKNEDVGVMRRIWRLKEEQLLPVLGICLGFQSLCLEFGGKVQRLKGPQHGIIRRVRHVGERGKEGQQSIFGGVGEIHATLYQSLCVDIGQKESRSGMREVDISCKDLVPLAWAESKDSLHDDSGIEDDIVLVAARHKTKPFWALQYHPESICTNKESKKIVKNWFMQAQAWNRTRRQLPISRQGLTYGQYATRESLLSQYEQMLSQDRRSGSLSPPPKALRRNKNSVEVICHCRTIQFSTNLSIPDLVEAIQDMQQDHIILDSSNAYEKAVGTADVRGRYSIIGLDIAESTKFEYTTGSNKITQVNVQRGSTTSQDTKSFGGIWSYLAQYLHAGKVITGNGESPFWGGFMGYTTYELGLEGIDVKSESRKGGNHPRPDLCFAWVERSIVIDHVKNMIYVQQLAPRGKADDVNAWMDSLTTKLEAALQQTSPLPSKNEIRASVISITTPTPSVYESKVLACQSSIRAGDSYELCLTSQTHITLSKTSSKSSSSWNLYKTLRHRQPAPFSSYLRLGAATLVSCSPERFLTWNSTGRCELRPMKGTVKKSPSVQTLSQATALLDIPKEKAENLMIVDLVRHDLHGVCGSGNVQVPRLMVVEEYKSVFQMISVVVGQIPPPFAPETRKYLSEEHIQDAERKRYTGLDVLAASLPPGSMTGAPKKRSCEILQEIEGGEERGLYSGVVGYMDVRGRGDWSVSIRCMFKWDDEDHTSAEGEESETWHVGAGGAVTALSTAVGEREEMETKLAGTLGLFR